MPSLDEIKTIATNKQIDFFTIFLLKKNGEVIATRYKHPASHYETHIYETGEILDAYSGQALHNINIRMQEIATYFESYNLLSSRKGWAKHNQGRI